MSSPSFQEPLLWVANPPKAANGLDLNSFLLGGGPKMGEDNLGDRQLAIRRQSLNSYLNLKISAI